MSTGNMARLCTEFAPKATEFRPTGIPQLDIVWGGGVPTGKIVEIHGQAGLGKSTLLLQVALNRADAGDRVLYADAEAALSVNLMNGVGNQGSSIFTETEKGGIFTHLCPSSFSEVDEVFDAYLENGIDLIILDTIAIVSKDHSRTEPSSRLSKTNPAETSRLQAELLRIYRPKFARTGATLLVGNQMRKDISNWKSHLKPCGGISLDHGLDVRTKIYPQKDLLSTCKSFHKLMVTTQKNRLGCPHEDLPLHLHFGSGVRRTEALAMMLLHFHAFDGKRGQYVSPHLPKAIHGEQAFIEWVETNEEQAYEILSEKVGYELKGPAS